MNVACIKIHREMSVYALSCISFIFIFTEDEASEMNRAQNEMKFI